MLMFNASGRQLRQPRDIAGEITKTRYQQDKANVAQQTQQRMDENQRIDFYNSPAYKASVGATAPKNTGMPTSISHLLDAGASQKGQENARYWNNNDLNLSALDPTAARLRTGTVGRAATIGDSGFDQFEAGKMEDPNVTSTALEALRRMSVGGSSGGFDSPALDRDMGNERLHAMRLANYAALGEVNKTPEDRVKESISALMATGRANTDLESERTIRRAKTAQDWDVRKAEDDASERQLAIAQARYVNPAEIKGAADVQKAQVTAQGLTDREGIRSQQQGYGTLLSLLTGLRKTNAYGDPAMQQQIDQGIAYLQNLSGSQQFSPGVSALVR
jgi:hypothetical protein